MKKTEISNNMRVVNKRYWNKAISVLKKIEKEQNEELAFDYLCKLVLPSYFKELGFSYDNERDLYNLKGIYAQVKYEGGYAYIYFMGDSVNKTLCFNDLLLGHSQIKIEFSYKEQTIEKKIIGNLTTLASEILIGIRDVWNFSNPNLTFTFTRSI